MWRHAGPHTVYLHVQGDGLNMKCQDLTKLRGSVQVAEGDSGACVIGFKFSCSPEGQGRFFEIGTADRITFSSSSGGAVSTTAIDCTGFSQVRMEVITATTASTACTAIFEIFSYTPNDKAAFGEVADQGNYQFGTGINELPNYGGSVGGGQRY